LPSLIAGTIIGAVLAGLCDQLVSVLLIGHATSHPYCDLVDQQT